MSRQLNLAAQRVSREFPSYSLKPRLSKVVMGIMKYSCAGEPGCRAGLRRRTQRR